MAIQLRDDDVSELQESVEEEEELENLEEEVAQMAEKILDYRTTLPPHLTSSISSLLQSRTSVSEAGVSQGLVRVATEFSGTDDGDEAEKIRVLEQKISSNAAAMPVLLSRMKGYMARIDKLNSSSVVICPAFNRKMKQLI